MVAQRHDLLNPVGFAIFAVLALIRPTAPSVPAHGTPIVVRGKEMIKIRNVVKEPLYEVIIDDNFRAIFHYYSSPVGEYTIIKLDKEEMDDIISFRQTQCRISVNHSEYTSEYYLEVGVRCSSENLNYSVRQSDFSYNDLPKVFQTILQNGMSHT